MNNLYNMKWEYMLDIYSHGQDRRRACLSLGMPYRVVTLKYLADKYNLSYGYVRNVSSKENWTYQRKIFITKKFSNSGRISISMQTLT